MQENWVEIQNLGFSRDQKVVLKDISLNIKKHSITAIMGPAGCGKTTLLRLIAAQLYPDRGRILINKSNFHILSRKALHAARKKIGFLFQTNALFSDLSVFDNVAFPLRAHTKLDAILLRDIVLMKLEAVGLRGAASLMPSSLSGGMARRVALARALVLEPHLMMYDEPFTGQDPISLGVLARLMKTLSQLLPITSIIVSHDIPETCAIADYIYLMAQGQLIGEGTPLALQASKEPQIRQFMHGEADGIVPFHYPARPYLEELMHEQ